MNNQDVIIRVANLGDIEEIRQVDNVTFEHMQYPLFVIRQLFELAGSHFLVAENKTGKVVGYTIGHLDKFSGLVWILALAVLKQYRDLKIGYQLTSKLLQMFELESTFTVKLTVTPENHGAIKLYKKMGFRETGGEDEYFGKNEERLLMKKKPLSYNVKNMHL